MSAAAAAADAVPTGKKPGGREEAGPHGRRRGDRAGRRGRRRAGLHEEAAGGRRSGRGGRGDSEASPAKAAKKKEKGDEARLRADGRVRRQPGRPRGRSLRADRHHAAGPDEKVSEEIKTYLPAIRNNILLLLAHKSSADLAGGEGKAAAGTPDPPRGARGRWARKWATTTTPSPRPTRPRHPLPSAKKKKHKGIPEDAPIRSVQFSSFIIQ